MDLMCKPEDVGLSSQRLGFKIARRYAGLVKDLGERRDGPPPEEAESGKLGD